MILLVDNYDSFVDNLARYVCELGGDAIVCRNCAYSTFRLQPSCESG
jgi:anthranilate/para-aminobenzoate synthase component II